MAFPPYTFRTQGNPLIAPPAGPSTAAAQLDANFSACAAIDFINVSSATKLALPVSTATTGAIDAAINGLATVARTGQYNDLIGKPSVIGTVTSVNVSGGTTGLSFTGGPITTTGTITASGVLAAANGGTGITALGTGVASALGANVGSAGAPIVFNGAGGTPASLTLTNATGLPVSGGGTGAATFTDGGVMIGNGTGAVQVTSAGTAGQVLTSNGTGVDPTFQPIAGAATYAQFQQQRSSGTPSVDALTATTWNKRVINTTVANGISGASLAMNSITLPAGTYLISAMATADSPATDSGQILRWYNFTDSATVLTGLSTRVNVSFSGAGNVQNVPLQGMFTIAGTKVFELDQWASAACGGGLAVSSGNNEVYVDVFLTKIA